MPGDTNEIGQRIAAARTARRMTQPDLAAAAHISLSALRKVEQGRRRLTDPVLASISEALGLDPEQLVGQQRHTNSRVHGSIPAIRAAVETYDLPDDGPVRSLPDLQTAVRRATQLRLASQYTRLAESIPPLMLELSRGLASARTGDQQRDMAAALVAAYRAADSVAYKYGYYDLSARLVELMRWAAGLAADPALWATVAYVRTETFFASGNLAPALRALEKAAESLAEPNDIEGMAALGALHMRAAVVAARHTEDPSAVDDHLGHAARYAARVPEGTYNGTAFGPASLRVHQVSVATELGDGSRALEAAADWEPPLSLPPERRSHYYIDLSRAQLWMGMRDEAFASLQMARSIAPQHVREHPFVREGLATLLRLHLAPAQALMSYVEWARAI